MGHLLKQQYALGTLKRAYFSFNKCLIDTNNGAYSKFSTYWDETETDYSVEVGAKNPEYSLSKAKEPRKARECDCVCVTVDLVSSVYIPRSNLFKIGSTKTNFPMRLMDFLCPVLEF